MHIRTVLTLAVLLVPLLSSAEVFRCTDPAGKVEYSDSPCVSGTGKVILVNQNVFPGAAAREQALVDENRRLRSQLDAGRSAEPAAVPAATIGRTDADLAAEKSSSQECAQARKNFEFSASARDLSRNTQADELAVYVACGIRPPDKVVNVTGGGGAGVYRPFPLRDARVDRPQPRPGTAPIGTPGTCMQTGARLGCL